MKKTVIVCGGAGFIGFHLCRRLLAEDHRVIAVDNFFSGSVNNVDLLMTKGGFLFLERDIIADCRDLADFKPTEIYNLACCGSPHHYQKDPLHTFKSSVLGAINLAELALATDALLFQASTSEVYGDPEKHPQSEDYWGHVNPVGARACYDEGKRGAETILSDYRRHKGLKVKIARIFNTYGPHMLSNDGRAVANFITQALQNRPLTIYGDGSQTRSFLYIDDLIAGIIALMNTTPSDSDGPINLGNPQEITIGTLAETILSLIPESSSTTIFAALPTDDPRRRCPDIALARSLLAWEPLTDLQEGLKQTIAFFKQQL